MRKTIVLAAIACILAGALYAPAGAKKKKPRVPVPTSLYLHGTDPAGELESFLPVVHEGLLMMDGTSPTSEEKSKQITNYGAGPNTQCAGNNLFPAWIGDVSGKVSGDMKFVFTSLGSPGLVDIRVWADIPGGTDFCNEGYVEPDAQALGVPLPAGEADVEAVLKGASFAVRETLIVQISPSTVDVAGTQRPGSNLFVSRIEYDSEGHPSALSFGCVPPPGRVSCLPGPGARAAAPEGWYVVSYERRIEEEDRARLDRVGAEAVSYLPVDRYVAWLDRKAAGELRRARTVASVDPLSPRAKLSSSVQEELPDLAELTVFGDRASSVPDTLSERFVAAYPADARGELYNIVVEVSDAGDVRELARRPEVLSIGPAATGIELLDERSSQIVAGNVRDGLPQAGYRAFLDRLGLDGSGVTIAIADSGIDDNHPDLAGRVAQRVDYTALPDYRDSDGHGTHVAGIAAGSGTGIPGATDPEGFAYGQGIAPGATMVDLGVLGIIEETAGIDEFPPFERVSRAASRAGAVAWNASWGSGEGDRAGYTPTARTMDIITRDADWKKRGEQPFMLVFAAGNSGMNGPGAPTEAKNLIAVASSRSDRAGSIDEISSFSSRGPTKDGRLGPTVAAPGEEIVSTRGLPATVLCNTPPAEASPFAAFYGTCSGTSMAAPHVTGSVALITQWWKRAHGGKVPSPAMTKALLVNSATDMGVPDIPNVNEGWGRVNLRALLDPRADRIYLDQTEVLGERGDALSLEVRPVDPSKDMKVTLVWSDAPALVNARSALVNDLDLVVRGGGATWFGNAFKGGTTTRGGRADRREVVENVFIARPSGGSYRIQIRAFNLPGDGIPGGDATDQDFALVITNARRV